MKSVVHKPKNQKTAISPLDFDKKFKKIQENIRQSGQLKSVRVQQFTSDRNMLICGAKQYGNQQIKLFQNLENNSIPQSRQQNLTKLFNNGFQPSSCQYDTEKTNIYENGVQ